MRKPALVFSLLLLHGVAAAQPGPAPSINSLDWPQQPKPPCLDSKYGYRTDTALLVTLCTKYLAIPGLSGLDRYNALTRRAGAHYYRRAFQASITDLTAAIALFPEYTEGYDLRAGVYTSTGKLDLARKDIDVALRMKPNDPDILNSSCWNYGARYRPEPALKDCNKSLTIRPGDSETIDSRAFAYFRAGKYDLALTDYNAALAIAPRQAESLYVRGIIKRKMGDLAGGNKDMHAATAINPDIVDYFAHFGLTRGN